MPKTRKKGTLSDAALKKRVLELVERNLFLDDETRSKVLQASPSLQREVLPLLEKIDNQQVEFVKAMLEENPNFFEDMETMAIHEALKELVEKEQKVHLKEIQKAEAELEAFFQEES